ncbi:MAG: zinc ABC transporter substrate-binding protein [Deltaproteobacteria bacterium]|nr:zinc ABC transporter substrate-binding protein [Deltaproteobacteria bacterium]
MKRFILFLSFFFSGILPAQAQLKVVTTLSTFADLAKQVGGGPVEVSYIASPKFDPHFIEPKPSDVLKVKRADLFIHAGLDLELWRYPLVDAAGKSELRPGGSRELDLSRGIGLLQVPTQALTRASGDVHLYGNPHYWLNPENAKIMARSIAEKLSQIDPDHEADYQKNLQEFVDRLDQKISEWRKIAESVQNTEVVAYHNSWPYLAQFLGIRVEQFLEPKPGIPPTPKQIGFLENYIQKRGIQGIIQETFYPKSASEPLAKRAGAQVVPLCQNVGELPQAIDYISMIGYNVDQLLTVLR